VVIVGNNGYRYGRISEWKKEPFKNIGKNLNRLMSLKKGQWLFLDSVFR
jgi:hypothetical protein